jgi:TPP-dependent 2-oxoacid decarboxylase
MGRMDGWTDNCVYLDAARTTTGDSWFHGQNMKLPHGCGYEFQMQYGSIGWSVGAVLGYAVATKPKSRRVVAMIGDGSFQMTAQVGLRLVCLCLCVLMLMTVVVGGGVGGGTSP